MKKTILLIALGGLFFACEQAKEADVDKDGMADVLIRGEKIKDFNKLDNIFVYNDVVVNGVTNEQWYVKDGVLEVVNHPTFKMKYDPITKEWSKISVQ